MPNGSCRPHSVCVHYCNTVFFVQSFNKHRLKYVHGSNRLAAFLLPKRIFIYRKKQCYTLRAGCYGRRAIARTRVWGSYCACCEWAHLSCVLGYACCARASSQTTVATTTSVTVTLCIYGIRPIANKSAALQPHSGATRRAAEVGATRYCTAL